MARRDPDYKFVLAELDYLKPYWDAYPRTATTSGSCSPTAGVELVGRHVQRAEHEPHQRRDRRSGTLIYGIGYQRDVLGGAPATAWQLDAFGHDPQFPGSWPTPGVRRASRARGPFHEWGPNWVRGPGRMPFAELAAGERPRMQFPMEFDWIAPSGAGPARRASWPTTTRPAGGWMPRRRSRRPRRRSTACSPSWRRMAATKNVLLPVGTDYTPAEQVGDRDPARLERALRLAAVHDARIPREFFAAVRAAQAAQRAGRSRRRRAT